MQYTILIQLYLSVLIEEVREKINEGWVPQGGVTVGPDSYYYQAMVKFDERKDQAPQTQGEETSSDEFGFFG